MHRAGAETAGWQTVDAGPFRVSLPPGYRKREVRGIDSFVGEWAAPGGRRASFDYGEYSWPMEDAATRLEDYRECTTEIGGHPVKVISGYDAGGHISEEGRKYVIAAAWRALSSGAHLTLVTRSRNGADLPALISIVRSIRFDQP